MTKQRHLNASRIEHLAVLRGEIEYQHARGADCCVKALQRAQAVLERMAAPSAPSPSADPDLGRRGAKPDFIGGLLDG